MEKIEYFRTNSYDGTLFQIISKKGNRNYAGSLARKKEDRLFFIRLIKDGNTLEFPFSYSDQHRLMELVMNNIIFEHIFEREYNTFIKLMNDIKKNRTKETTLDKFTK